MKIMVASDIHGSAYYCRKMLEAYKEEKAERLILLGDLLYHGPRNDLPKDYNPKEVIKMLNESKNDIICVRGNCEACVDQMVLDFPVMSDMALLSFDGKTYYATHGHVYNKDNPPKLLKGDILLCGHTHVPANEPFGDQNVYLNPGSVSIPKENSGHSYILLDGGAVLFRELTI